MALGTQRRPHGSTSFASGYFRHHLHFFLRKEQALAQRESLFRSPSRKPFWLLLPGTFLAKESGRKRRFNHVLQDPGCEARNPDREMLARRYLVKLLNNSLESFRLKSRFINKQSGAGHVHKREFFSNFFAVNSFNP